ncbi:hypothetical protein [Amphiplicatus metriothermophilus]|uniref:Uncharacterized protein n=1 Tax=Amphiplicatus metriothermophilus TaxID=1519374 RepID=A0A239PIM3_9PROT|nr:hypothetical protein [Amphiplicatus metriothermophilus]MBB5518030.1 hypothetical protein [Amphiplicatus metriothermophilus]SNT67636.1 hypothetical protein SAMN06297382_0128 [Amphiplicatus metriothermophilus]
MSEHVELAERAGAGSESAAAGKGEPLLRLPVIATLIVWGALSALAAANGLYQSVNGAPPYGLVAAAILPPLAFCAAYGRSAGLRRWADEIDLGLVTALQGWRVVGAAFVFVWGLGMLPAVFAAPAGFGDIAVGLAAPFVALAVWRRSPGWRRASYALIAAGLFDFAAAFATGALAREGGALHQPGAIHTGLMAELPLALIPGYLVPAFAILHLIAFFKLRRA